MVKHPLPLHNPQDIHMYFSKANQKGLNPFLSKLVLADTNYFLRVMFSFLILEDTSKTNKLNKMYLLSSQNTSHSLSYLSLTWRCCLIYNFITFSFWNCCMTHCHHCQKLTYYRCSWLQKKGHSVINHLSNKNRYGQIIVKKNLLKDFSSPLKTINN